MLRRYLLHWQEAMFESIPMVQSVSSYIRFDGDMVVSVSWWIVYENYLPWYWKLRIPVKKDRTKIPIAPKGSYIWKHINGAIVIFLRSILTVMWWFQCHGEYYDDVLIDHEIYSRLPLYSVDHNCFGRFITSYVRYLTSVWFSDMIFSFWLMFGHIYVIFSFCLNKIIKNTIFVPFNSKQTEVKN